MSEPRTIDSAPKDGSVILIYPGWAGKHFGWVTAYWHQPANPEAKGFWVGHKTNNHPTHWLPLPKSLGREVAGDERLGALQ